MPKSLMIPAKGIKFSPYKDYVQSDFTTGLVMARGADSDPKATGFCLNVDQFPTGGFGSRKGMKIWTTNSQLPHMAATLAKYETPEGLSFLMMGLDNGDLFACQQGPGPVNGITAGVPHVAPRGIEANYVFYFQHNAQAPASRWTYPGLASTLKDTFTNPNPSSGAGPDGTRTPAGTQGAMPICKYMIFYHQRMFCFWTNESGTMHRNRVRWSYPVINGLGAEDFRGDTWVDIEDGADGDEIVGATTHGPSIFIFKRNSIHHAEGFDETDVSFLPLNLSAGAVGPDAIVNSQDGIFFWDASKGLCMVARAPIGSDELYNVEQLSFQLGQTLLDGSIPSARIGEVTLGISFGGVKVYCAVPWKDGGKRTLVYNRIMKNWTMWDCSIGAQLLYRPAQGRPAALATHRIVGFPWEGPPDPALPPASVLELEATEDAADDLGQGAARFVFPTRMRTATDVMGAPFVEKQIDVISFVCSGTGTFSVVVSHDFEPGDVVGSLTLTLPGAPRPDVFDLDVDQLVSPTYEILYPGAAPTEVRCDPTLTGAVLGADNSLRSGRVFTQAPRAEFQAVQLDITGPTTGSGWRIYAVSYRWFAKTRTT